MTKRSKQKILFKNRFLLQNLEIKDLTIFPTIKDHVDKGKSGKMADRDVDWGLAYYLCLTDFLDKLIVTGEVNR